MYGYSFCCARVNVGLQLFYNLLLLHSRPTHMYKVKLTIQLLYSHYLFLCLRHTYRLDDNMCACACTQYAYRHVTLCKISYTLIDTTTSALPAQPAIWSLPCCSPDLNLFTSVVGSFLLIACVCTLICACFPPCSFIAAHHN